MPPPAAPSVRTSLPAAILFPKLRIYFAEFLNEGCPAHLRILSVPTCVGFGTGALFLTRSFSRQCSSFKFGSSVDLPIYHFSALMQRICLLHSLPASTYSSIRTLKLLAVSLHHSNKIKRYRNFCLLSIAYAFRLGLGPDLPWVDERCPGILRLSVEQILTVLVVTHTGILSAVHSNAPYGTSSVAYSMLPYPECTATSCHGFGSVLEPRIFSAQSLSTSELLRTLLMMAASEPTSWLFMKSYILFHLAQHLGP